MVGEKWEASVEDLRGERSEDGRGGDYTREKVGQVCVGEGSTKSIFGLFVAARISNSNNIQAY